MMQLSFGPDSRMALRLASSLVMVLAIAFSSSFGQTAKPAAKPAAGASAPAAAGQYETLPYDVNQRRNQNKVMEWLRGGCKADPAAEKIFNDFFKLYHIGRWTQPENVPQLPALRKESRNLLNMFKTGIPHSRIVNILMELCTPLVSGNYDPVVRVNAMLLIGDLNFEEAAKANEDPIPLPAAVPVLIAQITSPDQIDAVRAAALVGLVRHARLGIRDADVSRDAIRACLTILNAKKVPGRSAAGNGWMRGQAAEVLGGIGATGDLKAVAEAMGQLVGDTGASVLARRAAAQALGRLDLQSAAGLNRETLANALGRLAVNACQAAKGDPHSTPAVRRMKSVLYACSQGIGAVAKGVDPAQQAFVRQVQEKLTAMMAIFEEKDIRDEEVLQKMDPLADELENGLKKAA